MKELDYLDTKNYKDLPDDVHQQMIQNSRQYILEEKISDLEEEIERLRLLIIEWADASKAYGIGMVSADAMNLHASMFAAEDALRAEVGR